MIRGTNMNPGILQCENCQKWDYSTFMYYIYGAKCQKCNRPHKLKYYREIAQCCKANFKTNPPRLETKKGKLCIYSFKCIKYKRIIKQTAIYICFGNTDSIRIGTAKSHRNSKKSKLT